MPSTKAQDLSKAALTQINDTVNARIRDAILIGVVGFTVQSADPIAWGAFFAMPYLISVVHCTAVVANTPMRSLTPRVWTVFFTSVMPVYLYWAVGYDFGTNLVIDIALSIAGVITAAFFLTALRYVIYSEVAAERRRNEANPQEAVSA